MSGRVLGAVNAVISGNQNGNACLRDIGGIHLGTWETHQCMRDGVEPLTAYAARYRQGGCSESTVDQGRRALQAVHRMAASVKNRISP
jgi:hypothetical protein